MGLLLLLYSLLLSNLSSSFRGRRREPAAVFWGPEELVSLSSLQLSLSHLEKQKEKFSIKRRGLSVDILPLEACWIYLDIVPLAPPVAAAFTSSMGFGVGGLGAFLHQDGLRHHLSGGVPPPLPGGTSGGGGEEGVIIKAALEKGEKWDRVN